MKPVNDYALKSTVYYESEPVYNLLGDQFRFLLPHGAFKKLLWKEVKKNLEQRLDMTCGRIRSDFHHRLDETAIKYIAALNQCVESALESVATAVEKGIEEKSRSEEEANKKLSELDERIKKLKGIRERRM